MIANVLVGLIGLLHVYILALEMFLWESPRGRKAFGLTPEFAAQTKVLAANQGLYNGFLAAGLFWGLLLGGNQSPMGRPVALFFLGCVIVAGVYGSATASRKIIFVQAVPGVITMAAVLLS